MLFSKKNVFWLRHRGFRFLPLLLVTLLLPAAAHVVQTADSITVKFLDGEIIPARE
jgi:hypothetical protein